MALSNNGRIRVNVTGARGPLGIDLQGTPVSGQFLVKSPGGGRTFTTASGTGADAALRSDLAAPTGSDNVGYSDITAAEALNRINSSSQLDGFIAGLSGSFGEDATAVIAELLQRAAPDNRDVAGHVHLPRGQYRRSESLEMYNQSRLSGDGARATKLQSLAGGSASFPLLTNADPDGANFQWIENIGFWGGTAGYQIEATGGCDDFRLDNVEFIGQTDAGIVANRLFQVAAITNANFENCNKGIWVKNHTSNAVIIIGGNFKSLADAALDLNGVEALICIGTRFEAGGLAGKYTLDLQNVRVATFVSCYFENTHEYLLRARRTGDIGATLAIPGSISFQACHFTYNYASQPYKWDADGAITFRDCNSGVPMRVPSQSILEGHNRNLLNTVRSGKIISPAIRPGPVTNLVTIDLEDASALLENVNVLTATLDVSFARLGSGGVGFTKFSREYLVSVWSIAGQTMQCEIKMISSSDINGGATLQVDYSAVQKSVTIYGETGNVDFSNDPSLVLGHSFKWDQSANNKENLYSVRIS